jgi:hypothetical protein
MTYRQLSIQGGRGRVILMATAFAAAQLAGALGHSASANGFGENRPYQFRGDNARATLLNNENVRLQLEGEFGVGGASGLGAFTAQDGQPTGNSVSISGDGNTITQDNAGDQTTDNNANAGN